MVALYRVDIPARALGVEIGPVNAMEALERREDQFAVIDGPAFDAQGPRYALRDKERGIDVASRFPTRGAILCVVNGVGQARRGGKPMKGSTVAIQGEPSLVEAGVVVVPPQPPGDLMARSAMVLRRDGNVSLVAARAATLREFAEAISEQLDAEWAICLGTGDSTALVTRQYVLIDLHHQRLPVWVVGRRKIEAMAPDRSLSPAVVVTSVVAAVSFVRWVIGETR